MSIKERERHQLAERTAVHMQRAKSALERIKDGFVGGNNIYVALSMALNGLEVSFGINAAELRDADDEVGL